MNPPDDDARPLRYILDGQAIAPCADLMEWCRWFENANRRIAETVVGDARVSTVFLGIDHAWSDGPPILFETMVFGGAISGECERCSTYEQALAMHDRAVALVRATEPTG